MRGPLLAGIIVVSPCLAFAQPPGSPDPRIQTFSYDPDRIVVLRGLIGFQLMLEFAPQERLESVSIGDALGWQVTPNRGANLLFLKPLERNATTNLTVVTSLRRYAFDLRVAPRGARVADIPYIVRFRYPEMAIAVPVEPEPREPPPQVVNAAYVVSGSKANAPAEVFDDGWKTYFAWAPQASTPAIFALSADGRESLVNYGVRGGYTVVDQLAGGFVLRNGKQVTTVTNRAYRAPMDTQKAARR